MHNEDTHRTHGWAAPHPSPPLPKRPASTPTELPPPFETREVSRVRASERHVDALSCAFFDETSADETPVSEIMSRRVLCAPSDMPLDVLAYVMVDQQAGGTPVVDERGHPVGMISKIDLLRELREVSDATRSTWHPWETADGELSRNPLELESLAARTAVDAMTPIVYWLPEDASISQAAALMAYEHVHALPIVNRGGKVSGLVTTLDVLRWFARRRGYLIPR